MTPDDQVIREVDCFLIRFISVFFNTDSVLALGQVKGKAGGAFEITVYVDPVVFDIGAQGQGGGLYDGRGRFF